MPAASDHESVVLGVRNVTNTSAILEWDTPEDRPILKFKVSAATKYRSKQDSTTHAK